MNKIEKIQGHYYTSDEIDFIKQNYLGKTTQELTDLFNKKFKTSLTYSQIFSKRKNLKLKSGVVTRFKKGQESYPRGIGYQHRFTKFQLQFLKDKAELPNYFLTELFNEKFQTKLEMRKIISAKKRHNIKGSINHESRYITGFKKGNIPYTRKEIGSESYCGGKYKYKTIKIKDGFGTANYQSKHRLVWEKQNGPIPKGHKVVFIDGNKNNFDINNLALVSNAEEVVMNRLGILGLKSLFETGLNLARIKIKLSSIRRKR